MTLTELQQEVYTLTNRPDLVPETLSAVRSATLKLHQSDYYYKDIFETGVTFSPAAYLQQLEYKTLIPRWRALKYIRKVNSPGDGEGKFLEVLAIPEMVEDQYGINKSDVCYVAGAVVNIKSSTLLDNILLGCYLHPDITVPTYTSWIAQEHPYAIVFEAAASVYKMVGDTDQYAAFSRLALGELELIKLSNIQSGGY